MKELSGFFFFFLALLWLTYQGTWVNLLQCILPQWLQTVLTAYTSANSPVILCCLSGDYGWQHPRWRRTQTLWVDLGSQPGLTPAHCPGPASSLTTYRFCCLCLSVTSMTPVTCQPPHRHSSDLSGDTTVHFSSCTYLALSLTPFCWNWLLTALFAPLDISCEGTG